MRSPRLPESVIDDRITRYMTDEPFREHYGDGSAAAE